MSASNPSDEFYRPKKRVPPVRNEHCNECSDDCGGCSPDLEWHGERVPGTNLTRCPSCGSYWASVMGKVNEPRCTDDWHNQEQIVRCVSCGYLYDARKGMECLACASLALYGGVYGGVCATGVTYTGTGEPWDRDKYQGANDAEWTDFDIELLKGMGIKP